MSSKRQKLLLIKKFCQTGSTLLAWNTVLYDILIHMSKLTWLETGGLKKKKRKKEEDQHAL